MTRAWLLVAVLWVVGCLNYLDRQVIFSLFPLLQEDLQITPGQFGLLSTVFLVTYGLLSPVAGYLADRFGRARMAIGSLLVWSAVTWTTGHAQTFGQLLGARALMGISEAFYIPAALALIAQQHGERTRSLATGIHQSGLYAGIISGGAVGGWLGEHYGWRYPFVLLGGIGVVYSAVVFAALRGSREPSRQAENHLLSSLTEVFRLQGYGRLLFVFSIFGLANWLVYTWLPLYLYERFGLSLTSAGFSATFYLQTASFAGILLGGIAADRLASRRGGRARVLVQATGLAAAAPFLFLAAWTSSFGVLITALVAFGLGRGMYDSNAMPVLCLIAPERVRATGYGVFNLFACIVGGLTAGLAGWLKSAIGLDRAFQMAAGLLAVSAIALLMSNIGRKAVLASGH